MRRFQLAEFAHERVELRVRDLGVVVYVVALLVVPDEGTERIDAVGWRGHAPRLPVAGEHVVGEPEEGVALAALGERDELGDGPGRCTRRPAA